MDSRLQYICFINWWTRGRCSICNPCSLSYGQFGITDPNGAWGEVPQPMEIILAFQTLICKYQEAPYLTFLFYFIYFLLVSILKIWLFSSSSWSFFPRFHLSGTIPNTTVIVILLTCHLSSKLSNSSCKSFDQKVSTWFTCYKRASHLNGLGYS